jgi:diaminopimelate decarboxylase/aspartate kinase
MPLHPTLGVSPAVATPYPDSPWVVLKFGGRSVSTAENWAIIAELIRDRLAEGVRPVVVHSALVGVSNALIALLDTAVAGGDTDEKLRKIRAQHDSLAKELKIAPALLDARFAVLEQVVAGVRLVGEVSPRVHARVLSFGELAATELGAAYLKSLGLEVAWLDIREYLESQTLRDQTERARFLSARCDFSADKALQERFGATKGIVLSQGFIARNAQGETVLLGRGGSDTSGA